MNLTPETIKDHLNQIGIKEALRLLKEWVLNSNDVDLRRNALELIRTLDDGKDFNFFESLFLSDENINIRLASGKILKEKYPKNKNIFPLLEFTLDNLNSVEQQFLAAKSLNSLNSEKYHDLIKDYLMESIKTSFKGELEAFPIDILSPRYDKGFPSDILELCFHLIHSGHYVMKDGVLILLNCEGGRIRNTSEIIGSDSHLGLEHLYLKRNDIEVIGGLDNLEKLKVLNLDDNMIRTIENLGNLSNLEELTISNNKIHEISGLQDLNNLKKLSLNHNILSKIEGLETLNDLEELHLNNNSITSIGNLEGLSNLKVLNLSFNNIEEISGLEDLKSLRYLYLNENDLSCIKGLERLENLKTLNLTNNQITQIEGFDNLKNLTKLELSGNKIQKIEGLDELKELQELFLDRNSIKKFEGMEYLARLIILFLEHNEISELKMEYFNPLKNLNFSFLNENPLSPESQEVYRKRCRFP